MANTAASLDLKKAVKAALLETLHEEPELLHEVFAEVLEDYAMREAMREGQRSKRVSRSEVFRILDAKP